MDIQFCDLCNESVPFSDMERGRAFQQAGRLVCANCDRAMGGGGAPHEEHAAGANGLPAAGAPAPLVVTRGGGGAAGVFVGLLALAVAGGGLALFLDRLEGTEAGLGRLEDALTEEGRARNSVLREQDQRLQAGMAELGGRAEARSEELMHLLQAQLAALQASDQKQLAAFAGVQAELEALRSTASGKQDRIEQLMAGLGERMNALETDQRFYADRVVEFEEGLRELATREPAAPAGMTAPGAAQAGPAPWEGLLGDLAHASSSIRMEAVYDLAETGDPRVVSHLVPMLGDEDLFVRMATARAMMDLDGRAGVPGLIETLEDSSGAVREAAMVALRKIAGRDFGFEPLASDADRAKRVKAWRTWWKKEGTAFLAA
ncbi:MAG: hypothetical protein ACI8QC_001429 [Planctomycetota bacterium]|jgi:hypothetical protein